MQLHSQQTWQLSRALKEAVAGVAVVEPVAVTIKGVKVDGTAINLRRLSESKISSIRRLPENKEVTVDWEVKHDQLIAPAKFTEAKIKEKVEKAATKASRAVTVTSVSFSSNADTTAAPNGGGSPSDASRCSSMFAQASPMLMLTIAMHACWWRGS